MCKECGCGGGTSEPEHHHGHGHEHSHAHRQHETVAVGRSILEKNDRLAEQHRGFFRAKGILVLNVVSSPGSGKTTLIRTTAERLKDKARIGVVVGDLATDNDAQKLRTAGIPVVQVTTGTVCHLDSQMLERALSTLDLDDLDILIIENVGNLVCPASFDLGEDLRVVLLSVTEGEDKPLKYPPMFHSANVAILTKTDLAEAAGFDRGLAMGNLRRMSHHATLFEVSSRSGKGLDTWTDYLLDQQKRKASACKRPRSA